MPPTPPVIARAFTLIELLVVVCMVALLAATLVPTSAGSRIGSQTFRCQNNNRQLAVAWRTYADDNNDRIVYAASDTSANFPYTWCRTYIDYTSDARNWDTNVDIVRGPLWPYTSKDALIYRCPSDHSYVITLTGAAMLRVRSFAMNLYTGGFTPTTGSGPGTDGGLTPSYRNFSKTTDLTVLGPAKTFVFIDMRSEVDIIWGNFLTYMDGYPNTPAAYKMHDLPGISHNLGASVSFADGRAEIHRWVDPRTAPPLSIGFPVSTFTSPNNVDIAWLQARATSPK